MRRELSRNAYAILAGISDAIRRLLEARTHAPVQSHEYYRDRSTAERDVEITEDELDWVIHEIRTEMVD